MTELVVGDFAGGIYWHDTGPAGTVRDAMNALVDDDGSIFRRGGVHQWGAYHDPVTLFGLAIADLVGGQRTLVWTASGLRLLDPWLISAYALGTQPPRCAVPAAVGQFLCLPQVGSKVSVYAGGYQTSSWSESLGTIATTAGSATIVGTGTLFTNVPPGAMLFTTGSARLRTAHTPTVQGVVQSVTDNTHLTLDTQMERTDSGLTFVMYVLREVAKPSAIPAGMQITVASVANRLVVLAGNRAAFSAVDDPFAFAGEDFHQLESAETTLGAVGLGGLLVWFATDGVWTVENMAVDLVSADGSIQQQLRQISKDVVLWGTPDRGGACGVVGWEGQLVVPAIDDVYVMSPSGSKVSIGAGIRPLLQFYVTYGCWPGTAAVFSGHYFLPVLNDAGDVIDMLVCRLASRAAWTRWDTLGAQRALAVQSHRAGQRPELIGVKGRNLFGLTDCFSALVPDDDGDPGYAFDVTTHDIELGPGNLNTLQRVRARYEMNSGGVANVTVSHVIDGTQADLSTVGDSDGYRPASWWLAPVRRARRVRLRVRSSGATATMRLHSLALTVRPSSRSS